MTFALRAWRSALTALFALSAAACAPQGAAPGSRLVIAQLREPASLNPLLIDGSVAEALGALCFSYLVAVDARGRLAPDAAAAVPTIANGGISRDGLHVTYHLRRRIRWQDGAPLTARDVIFTYRAVMNPRNNVPTRLGFDQIAAIEAPDSATVRVTLKRPFAPFVTYFLEPENYPILPAHLLDRLPSLNDAAYNRLPVGSGPYRVTRWLRGDRMLLTANAGYWRGAPSIGTIVVRFIANEETIVTGLRAGEIDATFDVSPAAAPSVRKQVPQAAVRTYPSYGFGALLFNTRAGGVADVRIRRAIAALLDRDVLARKISHDTLRASDAPRGLFGWAYDGRVRAPAHDENAARAALDDARVTLDVNGARWYRGKPFALDLVFDNSSTTSRSAAIMVQEAAARAGIAIRLRGFTPLVFHAFDAAGPLASGHFALALDTVLTGYDPETSWFFRCDQAPPAGSNYARWCDRAADAAQNDALATFDQARRLRDYGIVQRRVAADLPVVFLWEGAGLAVTPQTLRGFAPSAETPFANAERWKIRSR